MKLPSTISRFEVDIEKKLKEFEGKLSLDDITSWILQFHDEDQSLAIKLFLKLKYFTSTDVTKLCKTLYSRLPQIVKSNINKTLFIGFGVAADSGSMLIYPYRVANNIPQSNFLDLDNLQENIVDKVNTQFNSIIFIDDFIGTGSQAIAQLSNELKEIINLKSLKYVGFQAIVGFMDSIRRIRNETNIEVIVSHELTEKDKVFHEASQILTEDYFELERYRNMIFKYGEKLYPIGPLGYGNTQALISFYYNTPNNTLPIFWVSIEGWRPLLPRTEAKKSSSLTKNENLVLLFIDIMGGKFIVNDLSELLTNSDISLIDTIKNLDNHRFIRIREDEYNKLIELTIKGNREVQNLYEYNPQLIQDGFHNFRVIISSLLSNYPKHSLEFFNRIKRIKSALINLVKSACKIGDIEIIMDFEKTVSWLLLKEWEIEERINLGKLILSSFDKNTLGKLSGYINIDDLGWSYIINKEYDKAKVNIDIGLTYLWQQKDAFGLCQGWRHLQGLKRRIGNFTSAAFGMRIVYGASCAINDNKDRLHMQGGILRGLASIAKTLSQNTNSDEYLKRSIILAGMIGDEYHATAEAKLIQEAQPQLKVNQQKSFSEFTLYLVRHPEAPKNDNLTFGRHMLTHLTQEGNSQISNIIKKLSDLISPAVNKNGVFYSATSKVTHILSDEISKNLNIGVVYESLLDSINSGDLTGYSEKEAKTYFPEIMGKLYLYRKNKLDGYELNFPNGESVRDLTLRLSKFLLEKVYSNGCPDNCIIVGHNSSITAILNIITAIDRWPVDSSYHYFDVPLGSIMKVSFDNNTHKIKIDVL